MGELLKRQVSLIQVTNGFQCSYKYDSATSLHFRSTFVFFYCGPAMQVSTRCGRRNRNLWFGKVNMKVSTIGLLSGSIGLDTVGSNIGKVMVCQMEEENSLIQEKRSKFNLGMGLRDKTTGQPSTSLSITIPDVKVYFLEERDEEVLSRRLLSLSRSNKTRSALELYRSMELSGVRPSAHACNSLLSCLFRNDLLDHAFRVFESMRRIGVATGHSYSLLLKAVAKVQGCDSTLKLFAEMEGHSGCENFDVVVYNTVMSICGQANNWLETEKLWRKMKGNGLIGTEVTYSLLVSIFARCDQSDLAIDGYDEMVQNGIKPRADTMQAAIGVCAKEGKWNLALSIFQAMLNRGMKPNLIACNALINAIGKSGDVKLAFEVYDRMKSLGHHPDAFTFNSLLVAMYRADQHAGALELLEVIEGRKYNLLNEHIYHTALMSCRKLGLWNKAIQLFWKMEVSGLPVSVTTFNLVISACENAREPKVALQVYKHMLHRQFKPDTFTHLSLIRSCIWGSLWSSVEAILDQVEPDANLYNAAIHGMCLRGKFESAKKLYWRMRKRGLKPDGKTRAMMLQNLSKDLKPPT